MLPLIVIVGPTAVGKTALGFSLADLLPVEILCADSRQIYRELDIGTAKPTAAEQAQVPHHLFDIAEPTETYTVAQYQAQAEKALNNLWQQGKQPVLLGGTGLYVRTLLYDYQIPQVGPQTALREEFTQLEQAQPGRLHQLLAERDPASAQRLHPNDERRIIRALEVQAVTGVPFSLTQQRAQKLRYPTVYLGLTMARPLLEKRIRQRIAQMVATGLIEEVETLRQRYSKELPLLQTLNYAEIGHYLDGTYSLAEAQEQMAIHTRQYAKRQVTWFRQDQELQWFELDEQGADRSALLAWAREQILAQTGVKA